MVDNTSTNFPIGGVIFCDPSTGMLTKEARTLLRTLWNRTGAGTGGDITQVTAIANAALAGADASLKIVKNLDDLANVPTARGNLGLGSVALGNTVAGWSTPTGAGSRASFDANFTQTAASSYSQSDTQAIIAQLIAVQKALAQLVLDVESAKVISS